MPTVTSFTAARSQAIEDGAIVDGTVSGDNLILIRHDGSTIDAGSVRGPQGIQGPGGADIVSLMELLSPVGHMVPYGGSAAPTGWLICDGSSKLRTDYPDLFTAIGTAYGTADSTHFNIPDGRLKIPVGKTAAGTASVLGSYGGSKDAIVGTHSHNHSHVVSGDGAHNHSVNGGDFGLSLAVKSPGSTLGLVGGGTSGTSYTSLDTGGTHSHTVGSDNSPGGVDPTDGNLPPYLVANWIIRY